MRDGRLGVGGASGVLLLGLTALALAVWASPSVVGLLSARAPSPAASPRSRATLSRRNTSSDATGPGRAAASPRRQGPPPPSWGPGPKGAQSSEFLLIATNVMPGAPDRSSASLLDVKSDRYMLLSPGDHWGEFEVVRIAMYFVQLRRAGSFSWVSYGEGSQRSTRQAPSPDHRAQPRPVRRASAKAPTVTSKWLIGRLNLTGELEDHLRPTVTSKGVRVGRTTLGFRRIGVRVGDVIQRAGTRPVRYVDDIREGLQGAANPGGSGTITVLRHGRAIELDFNVQ
ncbi:MAG: hypothetical protein ABI333_15360 [bacterium]